jgi:Uma2 family endonuclease
MQATTGRAEIGIQLPFAASDDSEPEPDVYLVPPGDYLDDHPHQAFLIIEVADSSLRFDLRVKAELYARSQVTEYWVVDLAAGVVRVHRDPAGGLYGTVTSVARDGAITLAAFADVTVRVDDLLPPG